MALVVFLRGVNVGGHRIFRPSALAKELSAFDVVNVGAAGTFVVRKPGSRARFRAELVRRLSFEPHVVLCDARDLLKIEADNPFGNRPAPPGIVRFVSVLTKRGQLRTPLPISLPPSGQWLVRIVGAHDRFVFGLYRRHMKTIGYLGRIDALLGSPATTRNWNTITAIVRVLHAQEPPPPTCVT